MRWGGEKAAFWYTANQDHANPQKEFGQAHFLACGLCSEVSWCSLVLRPIFWGHQTSEVLRDDSSSKDSVLPSGCRFLLSASTNLPSASLDCTLQSFLETRPLFMAMPQSAKLNWTSSPLDLMHVLASQLILPKCGNLRQNDLFSPNWNSS